MPLLYGFVGAAAFWTLANGGPAVAQLGGSLPAYVKLQSSYPGTQQTGNAKLSGTIGANAFAGSGLLITSLDADNIAVGTLSDGRLSTNIARLAGTQTFTGAKTFTGGFVTDAFTMNVGAASGEVLKTNASGVGSWQADGLSLPFSDLVGGTGTTFALTNTGTGDLGVFTIDNPSSVAEAVQGVSNNGGDVFQATMTGTGRAGYFAINNSSSDANSVFASTNGTGSTLYAQNTHAGGTAITAAANAYTSGASYGVFSEISSDLGAAIYGRKSVGQGFGGGAAIYGQCLTGGDGVVGESWSNTYVGVLGQHHAGNGYGVFGEIINSSGTNYGVAGQTGSPNGYAVYAFGRSGASGTKSFRIDHPFDPAHKYLMHYSTEMPEPQNAYNGTVVTDANGKAWVELPAYFGEINKDPRYTLTVVDNTGSPTFVQAKIGSKIQNNRFLIMTSEPHTEVSWEVKAVRNDRWMRAHGAPVEVAKEGPEDGTYLEPEIYGQPKQLGVTFRAPRLPNQP